MTIVRCPRCRDEVTSPAKASTKALVRCPLCLEEYLLSEALAGVPPALIVVGGDAHDDDGEEYFVAGGGFAGVFDSSAPADASVAPARPSVTGIPRPKKQEKSAAIEFVKIVLGGVVGLAIGLVVLWWGFQRDPLELGPKVANYAPWLVPAQFHGKRKTADSEAAAVPKKSPKASARVADDSPPIADAGVELERLSTSPEPAGFDSGLFDSVAGGSKGGKLLEPNLEIPLELPKPVAANLDVPPQDLPAADPAPAATKTAADEETGAKPAPPMPDLTDLLPDNTPPAELSPANAKSVPSAAAFAQAVAAASDALAKYEGLPKDDAEARREAFTKLHQATGEVGRVISYLNPTDAELSEDIARLQELLDTISGAKGSSKLNPVKFLAAQQWPAAKQDDGLLVAGTVKDVQPVGRLFEITLDASSRSELLLPILTASNPEDICAVGDNLVVIGRVQVDPTKHLPGYEGDRSRVLLLGHAVRAPKLE